VAAQGEDALILPLRIDYGSDAWLEHVYSSMKYAVAQGAKVVSMSFGTYGKQLSARNLVTLTQVIFFMAANPETLFVIAAGNENTDMTRESEPILPGGTNLPNVLTVGAVDKSGVLASFSNVGSDIVDLFAPGVDINSAWPGGGMKELSGTSMATPYVAGRAARLLKAGPGLSGQAVADQLRALAKEAKLLFKKTDQETSAVLPIGSEQEFRALVL
jgi:subtilisin family serine protease